MKMYRCSECGRAFQGPSPDDKEIARLREESMQQARIISELREEINTQDTEITRLREANANNLEGWQQNVAGLNREIARLQNENGLLHGANQEAAETIALLREENRRWFEWSESKGPGLDAYREMGARLEKAERERDEARALLKDAAIHLEEKERGGVQVIAGQGEEFWHAMARIAAKGAKPDPGTHMDPGEWLPEFNPTGETK